MDYTAVVEVGCAGFAAVSGVFGWLWQRSEAQRDKTTKEHSDAIKELRDTIKELGDALATHKLHIAETYVTQTELTKAVGSLERSIERLIEAVNQNASEMREGFRLLQQTKADK